MKRLCVLLLFFKMALVGVLSISCEQPPADLHIKALDPAKAKEMARATEATVSTQLAPGLVLKLWGVDSLVADPVSIDIDDAGRIYYTRTNRQKDSEFDIRGHQDWEIESIRLQTIDDKRAFLHRALAPELSDKNTWLTDVNGDGLHDWRDMTVQKEHVYRVEDLSGDTVADRSQLVIEDFHDEVTDAAGGILKHGDDLFVGIGPDLWRIQENKYGLAVQKTSISHGYGVHIGFGGHGMSGIEVGPEGKIYWQIGDIGFNGVGPDGQKWEHPNSGVIVRANPDGSDFEVFAYGNRNTHEFVFDEYGNLISEDNDGDHPGESERIVYVVNGADIGWRINWQFGKYRDPNNNTYKVWMDERMYVPRHQGQAAYFLPTIRNFVNGPTGMLYNPGTALGPEYKNTFLVGEFVGNPTRSGIHAFTLKPKGASFEFGESKPVVMGILATGIDFGPDGALYMADWIEGWGTKDHGRIWRLDVQNPNTRERVQTRALLAADFADLDAGELAQHLRHPDMRVRQKAQFALATRGNRGLEVFKETLAQKEHQLARVHAVWGISQFARIEMKHGDALVPYLADSDPEIRAQAAKWLGDVRYRKAGEALIALLRDDYPRARFFAAEALGRTAHEGAIEPLVKLLASNNDEDHYIRHAASLALARIGRPGPVVALHGHTSRAVRLGAVLALRRMKVPGIAAFLKDSDEYIVAEAARAINDDLSIPEALPALGEVLKETRFASEPLLRRAINANLRVGTLPALQLLIDYAQREGAPVAMRAEAVDALSTWAKPSVLDRVDGRYRGEVVRDLSEVQTKAAPALIALMPHAEPSLRQVVVRATGRLKLKEAVPSLLARLKNDRDAGVREAALRALVIMGTDQTEQAVRLALADQSKKVRVAGLDLLPTAGLAPTVVVPLLAGVIAQRTTEEKQAAITTLGTLPVANTEPTFNQLLNRWQQRTLPPEVQLELAEAIEATKSGELKARLQSISRGAAADSLQALYAGALLGGDPQRGADIFWGHPTAQCVRCHSFNDYGGTAGPRINGVGARLTRGELLEALVNPSARIAPGFGVVTLELTGGTRLSGILVEETSQAIRIKRGDRPDSTIARTAIQKRIDSPSSMPPMQYLLTKKELRDVVAFLASLEKEEE